jgi:hypothetical protein
VKSNEARELMVERIQAAHAKWPSFYDMPETLGAKHDYSVPVNQGHFDNDPDKAYVLALYAAAYRGEPVGRHGFTIAVRKVEEKPI